MALEIIWSKEAELKLMKVINYLENNWTEKELKNFARKLEKQLNLLAEYPFIYKISQKMQG